MNFLDGHGTILLLLLLFYFFCLPAQSRGREN